MSVAARPLPEQKRRIGGSDVAKLMGLSKYGNAMDVYLRVVEGVQEEWSPIMERGAAVEPELRAFAQRHLGIELESPESDYHEHPTLDFARAQIDDLARFHGMPVAVDYKSANRWVKGFGPDGSDVVPEHYRIQMAWELACSDRDLGLLIVGFGEDAPPPTIFMLSHVLTYQLERDGLLESHCIQVAREFWENHVLPRIPPNMKPLGKKAKKS